MTKDLYVRNISPEATEDDLRKLFSVVGKVSYIHMVNDSATGQFKGTAYVKMSSEAEAKEAIPTLDGAYLINRMISVAEALPQKPPGAAGAPRQPGAPRPTGAPRPAKTASPAKSDRREKPGRPEKSPRTEKAVRHRKPEKKRK